MLYTLGDGCRERGQQAGLGFFYVGGRRLGIEARTAQLDVMGKGAWSMQSFQRPCAARLAYCWRAGKEEPKSGKMDFSVHGLMFGRMQIYETRSLAGAVTGGFSWKIDGRAVFIDETFVLLRWRQRKSVGPVKPTKKR